MYEFYNTAFRVWFTLSLAAIVLVGLVLPIITAAQGIRATHPPPGPVAEPEIAAEIEEALKRGTCDAVLSADSLSDTVFHSSRLCSRLRRIVSWDKWQGVYEEPYTFAIFERNQKYWYRENFGHNISYGLAASVLLCAIFWVVIFTIAAMLCPSSQSLRHRDALASGGPGSSVELI